MIQPGDRVDVVLDVYADGDEYRVVMVGVFEPDQHKGIPPLEPGASRNLVQTFLGMRHNFGAFRMGRRTDPASDEVTP